MVGVKGQLSAEMLIVVVIVLGLAIFLASVMYKSAGKTGDKITNKTEEITSGRIYTKQGEGDPCYVHEDCESGTCDLSRKKCI